MSNFVIRKAEKSDCPEILTMIQELARWQTMEEQCEMTLQMLETDGFGPQPFYHAFIAHETVNNSAVSYALCYYRYSTWRGKELYLEDIYVKSDYRRNGLGEKMMKEIAKFGFEQGCCGMFLACIEWNRIPMNLYKKLGAEDLTVLEQWHMLKFGNKQFKQLLL